MSTQTSGSVQSYSELIGYNNLDPFKRMAIGATQETYNDSLIEEPLSRGESCFVAWKKDSSEGVAKVIEGLGTKNIVAEEMYRATKDPKWFENISHDTVAMIVNDMITVGALPTIIDMHIAVGDSVWFTDEKRAQALIRGWRDACIESGAIWGGGETPTLRGIISPEYPELSGSATGELSRRHFLHGGEIQDGDRIILLKSSGIHANGLTVAREVAEQLRQRYMTVITESGKKYGECLLEPTINYVQLARQIHKQEINVHYMVNITGHGWRKLMRANGNFNYVVEKTFDPQPEFDVIKKGKGYSRYQMYSDFNMGSGFALYVPERSVSAILRLCEQLNYQALDAGYIEASDSKSVRIWGNELVFKAETLSIR